MTESYDCEGNEIKVEYDILGRKTALESRDSGRYIYEYNGEGKLQYESNSRLIAEGKRIGYFYDSFGRLSKIDYPDAKETVYEYGSPDTGEENAKGRLVRVSDSSGVMEYVYGDLGEIKEEKRTLSQKHNATLPDMTAVTKFESNYLGQMESITYPDNEVVSYAYDDAGQVVSVMGKNDHDTFNYVDMIGYDEFGQRIYMKYGNGVETTYEYKKETRLLESIRTENESRQLLQNIRYSFDAVGNIEGYVNDCKGMGNYETRQSYKYDSLYQLTGVNGFTDFNRHNISGTSTFRSNYSQTYEFDSIGNMKLKKSEEVIHTGTKTGDDLNYELNYVKDPLYAHRFISIGDRYYKYDEVGNVIGEQTGPYSEDQEESELIKSYGDSIYGVETAWGFYGDDEEADIRRAKKYHREYEWDERNQLIRSKDNNTEVMFVYGQDGKRTNKYTIDTETLYFNNYWSYYIDPSVNSCGGKVSKHIFLGETRLATSINSYNNVGTGYHGEEKDHIYFYHSDHLGSAQLVTDWKGCEYQRIEYTPYGESWVDIKIAGATTVVPVSYNFSAKERDEETGLYYFGFRYLDPKYSKWLSTDPALGDYIPGAGKGNTQDSGKLPGMGGVFNHINGNLYAYAANNPIRYTDPDGRASILSRTINDSKTNKSYHLAHVLGEKTKFSPILHGLVDRGKLGGFKGKNSVYQYSGSKSGFTTNDAGSETSDYIIQYTGMDDNLTDQAAKNVLASERFGSSDNEKAKKLYKIFSNDCNDFTKEVFKEYKSLWINKFKNENPNASNQDVKKAWKEHETKISSRKGEIFNENQN